MKRMLYVFLGTLSLILGIIGAFLPVLPTTPFILLALFCYVRGSQRLHDWLLRSRWAGKHVHNVLAGRGIPLSVKIFAIAVSFCMMGYVGIIRDNLYIRLGLAVVFIVQVYFMIRIPTYREPEETAEVKPEIQRPETPPA